MKTSDRILKGLSKAQREVIIRLHYKDQLSANVVWSFNGDRVGLGVFRFVSDDKFVTLQTINILRDLGWVRYTNHGMRDFVTLERSPI